MRAVCVAASAAILIALAPASSPAQPEDRAGQDAKDSARTLAEKGYELFEAGKYAEAMDHFKQAEQKFHASPHLLFIARSLVALGKLIEGRDAYEKVVGEKLANYAPDAFRTAQADAKKELEALRARIPALQIAVTGAEADRATVTVDGAEAKAWRSQPVEINPGVHRIVASADGKEVTQSVNIVENATASVALAFEDRSSTAAPPGGPDVEPPAPSTGGSLVPAIVAFGVGAVGLGVGAVTGAISLGKVSDVESKCPAKPQCPKDLEGDADSAKTLGNVSTLAFIIGGIGVGAGVVLLVLRGNEAPPAASTGATAWSVRPRIGLGSAYLDGRF